MQPILGIVIPCYNEQEVLHTTIKQLSEVDNDALNSFFLHRYLIETPIPLQRNMGSNRTHGYGWRLS